MTRYIVIGLFILLVIVFYLLWNNAYTTSASNVQKDNQINPVPILDTSSYHYFIVMRHGGRISYSKAPPSTGSDPLSGIRTTLLHGLTKDNEWNTITDPTYPYLPTTSSTSINGVRTSSGHNVWMKNNDTAPLTDGGYRRLKSFVENVKPFLPSSYDYLYASSTQRTVQTASVVYSVLGLTTPFQTIDISEDSNKNNISVRVGVPAISTPGYWIDPSSSLLYHNSNNTSSLVTGLYTVTISSGTSTDWISGKTYVVYKGVPTNPQGQIFTSNSGSTCDPIFIGNIATTDGKVQIQPNGLNPSMLSSFQPYMYDTGHLIQTPVIKPRLHEQMYAILSKWFAYQSVTNNGLVHFDMSSTSYGIQGMMDWVMQQYVDKGKWVSSDPSSPNYLCPDEFTTLCNFYYSNMYATGTSLWNKPVVGAMKDSSGNYLNPDSIAAKLNEWTNTNNFFVCHETIIHALISSLGLVLSLHNGHTYIATASMLVFRKNKKTNQIDAYYLSPDTDQNSNYIDVSYLVHGATSSPYIQEIIGKL